MAYKYEMSLPIDRKLYSAIHVWLRNRYGRPQICEGTDCTNISRRYEWAKVQGKTYDFKRKNFKRLCHSCHMKYDSTEKTKAKLRARIFTTEAHARMVKNSFHRNRTHCKSGHSFSGENLAYRTLKTKAIHRACRICLRQYWAAQTIRRREKRLLITD